MVVRQVAWTVVRWLAWFAAGTMLGACASSNDDTGGTGGTGAPGGTGDTGGATWSGGTGGTDWSGGAPGTGGVATGGTSSTGGDDFWTGAYDPNCTPAPVNGRDASQGHHNPGTDCMTSGCHSNPTPAPHNAAMECASCHSGGSPDGSGAPEFMFGGTAYQAGTTTGAAQVEVGVKSGSTLAVACSAANGNFWVLAGPDLTWSSATTRIRTSAGEVSMQSAPTAACNASGCHDSSGTFPLDAP
jgi:hypothetical protein